MTHYEIVFKLPFIEFVIPKNFFSFSFRTKHLSTLKIFIEKNKISLPQRKASARGSIDRK